MSGRTCPRDAAAIGSGDISEKSMSIGIPSSFSIMSNATLVEKGAMRSCNSESSSKYDGGITSYRGEALIKKRYYKINSQKSS